MSISALAGGDPGSDRPNIAHIRERVSIEAVARELGMQVDGCKARCYRPGNHRNGDQDPSMRFHRKKNRGRCFICDPHAWSNIDLVMAVLECEMLQAVLWIADRFPVQSLSKGAHVRGRESWNPRFRASDCDDIISMLVRSGIWADLSAAEATILPALTTFINRDTGVCEISYRGLMRYSGVGSPATISKALKHFQQLGILQVVRAAGAPWLRRVNRYRVTPDDPEFQSLIQATFKKQKEEIEAERQLQLRARAARMKQTPI